MPVMAAPLDSEGVSLVLVHGINSSSSAWASLRSALESDPYAKGLRVLSFQYDAKPFRRVFKRSTPSQEQLGIQLETFVAAHVPDEHELVLIGHSQGGLVLQRYFASLIERGRARELERVRAAILLACPNFGSEVAVLAHRVLGTLSSPQLKSLRTLDAELNRVRGVVLDSTGLHQTVANNTCPIPIHVFAGATDGIVSAVSARGLFPADAFEILDGDHTGILNFDDVQGTNYRAIRKAILTPRQTQLLSMRRAESSGATNPDEARGSRVAIRLDDVDFPLPARHFGREDLVQNLLTRAVARETSVVCVHGGGGEGKSTLVFHILAELAATRPAYGGAEFVFHWRFAADNDERGPTGASAFLEAARALTGQDVLPREDDYLRAATLAAELQDKHPLVVLENFDLLLGPESKPGINNPAVRRLITEVARDGLSHGGLVLLTSTKPVPELEPFRYGHNISLPELSDDECVQLLRFLGATGTYESLVEVARAEGHYPLALYQIGHEMRRLKMGADQVSRRGSETARTGRLAKVLSDYEETYRGLSEEKTALAVLSLFRNPVPWSEVAAALAAARTQPELIALAEEDWNGVCASLRERGIAVESSRRPTHYSIRPRAFRQRTVELFKAEHPNAFRAIHRELAQSCPDRYIEKDRPTVNDLSPIYDQVHHLCQAGLFKDAIDVFWQRLCRERDFYTQKSLGAFSDDLHLLSHFFKDGTWEPRADLGLGKDDSAWLLAVTAYLQNALGMLAEAEAMRIREVGMHASLHNRKLESLGLAHLSQTQVYQCKMPQALASIQRAKDALGQVKSETPTQPNSRYASNLRTRELRSMILARAAHVAYFASAHKVAVRAARRVPMENLNTADAFQVALVLLDGLQKNSSRSPAASDIALVALVSDAISDASPQRPYTMAYKRALDALVAWRQEAPTASLLPPIREAVAFASRSGRLDVLPQILLTVLNILISRWDGHGSEVSTEIRRVREALADASGMAHGDLFQIESRVAEARYIALTEDVRSAQASLEAIGLLLPASGTWQVQITEIRSSLGGTNE